MVTKNSGFIATLLVGGLLFLGCSQQEKAGDAMSVTEAVANMNATQGNTAHGTVTFTMSENGMRVVAHFEDVPPGEHGFHIHEVGDCSAPDASSAGGHFNPTGMPHGGPSDQQRHIGDLGNISADSAGVAHKEFVDSLLTFEGANSILGKGLILHADADDLTSQPTGAAGGRLSCGVIEAPKQ
jgi:Cu-Zn family superoxide dismutase